MKIFTGEYGKDTVLENSLAQNQLLFPQISKYIIREYPQYSLTYMTEGLGRYASEKVIGGNSFEWWIKGRLTRPMTATGTSSGAGLANTTFTVEFIENHANSNDILKFADGTQGIAIADPVPSALGFTYTLLLQEVSATASLASTNVLAGTKAGIVGNAHTEASEKGFGNTVYPDKYKNYISTCRQAGEVSGDAATSVTWVESNGERVWYFSAEADTREKFLYELELQRWYNKINVDTSGNYKVFQNGKPIITGDGLLAQIDGSNVQSYGPTLTEKQITDFLADLRYTNGDINAKYMVFTGTKGLQKFQQAMKDYYIETSGVLMYDADAGGDISLGSNFTTYNAMGLKMTLVFNPLFDDPNLHHDMDPDNFPKESSKMVFVNFGQLEGGVSNLEVLVKGEGGINRGFVQKYITGMIDPFNPGSVKAANSKDSFTVEYLSQGGIILRRPKSCGIMYLA
jgi:hypothetical protein